MFKDSHSVLELPLLTVKVLRRLTGMRELPGMVGEKFWDVQSWMMGRTRGGGQVMCSCAFILLL